MLEKMLDLKNTFEGKFLAVLMSVVLVMSMTNILAFAGNEGQKDGSKTESAPTDQVVGESDKEAVDEAVQHGESAAAKDADASKTTPSQPLVSTTVDEAVVTFETQNAFVSVKNQLLSGTMLTTELHKELRFTASADTGFELGAITAKNAANADVPVTTQDACLASRPSTSTAPWSCPLSPLRLSPMSPKLKPRLSPAIPRSSRARRTKRANPRSRNRKSPRPMSLKPPLPTKTSSRSKPT